MNYLYLFCIDEKNVEKNFKHITHELIHRQRLVINKVSFRFTELEFYFFSEAHPDGYTHLHEQQEGHWRFHNSGLDITLRGKHHFQSYGGILIRVLRTDGNPKETYINGPRRVVFEIGKHLNAVTDPKTFLGIETGTELSEKEYPIFQTYREGLGKPVLSGLNTFQYHQYRFLLAEHLFKGSQLKDKEKIARSFNNPERAHAFLGYTLNQ